MVKLVNIITLQKSLTAAVIEQIKNSFSCVYLAGDSNQRVYIDLHSLTTSKLIILGLQPSDQGTYRCIVGQQSEPHTVILTCEFGA